MTRKDHILIAAAIQQVWNYYEGDTNAEKAIYAVEEYIAAALSKDNPRFNHDTFLAASGVQVS